MSQSMVYYFAALMVLVVTLGFKEGVVVAGYILAAGLFGAALLLMEF